MYLLHEKVEVEKSLTRKNAKSLETAAKDTITHTHAYTQTHTYIYNM